MCVSKVLKISFLLVVKISFFFVSLSFLLRTLEAWRHFCVEGKGMETLMSHGY